MSHDHDGEIERYGECLTCAARAPASPRVRFDGPGLTAPDHARLGTQMAKVLEAVRDGEWRTLAEISELVGAPEASVSARLRDLRKPKFGGHEVERRRRTRSLYEYRLTCNAYRGTL